MNKLSKAGIPVDEYIKLMDLAGLEFVVTDDPVNDFKRAVLFLNEKASLPSWLSHWCSVYGVEHKEMDVEPLEEDFFL